MTATLQHFILVFDARAGKLRELVECGTDASAAFARYVELERAHAGERDVQVVMLSARDLASLEATHSHYFSDEATRAVVAIGG